MNWDLVVAANNRPVLQSCLLSSPAIRQAGQVIVQWGFDAAGRAYNDGLEKAASDIIVFAHQDVYLPEGWHQWLAASLQKLSAADPAWAVAGPIGIGPEQRLVGQVHCTRAGHTVGAQLCEPAPSRSLDELLLIVRRSAGIRFDPQLPGFHLYGTDICLEASRRGLRSYVIPAFCIHNASGWTFLPLAFWRCYFHLRRKWWDRLPITTSCVVIQRRPTPVIMSPLKIFYEYHLRRRQRAGSRVGEPAKLFDELLRSGRLRLGVCGAGPSGESHASR